MKFSETILSSLAIATSVLAVETAVAVGLEGPNYVVASRLQLSALRLWVTYASSFLLLGVVIWTVAWASFRKLETRRRWTLVLLLVVFALPVVNATVKSRPSLERVLTDWRLVLVVGIIVVLATGWLIHASKRGHRRPLIVVTFALMSAIFGLTVVNVFVNSRLANQIASPAGVRNLAIGVLGSWLFNIPLAMSLWCVGRSAANRWLAAVLGYGVGAYASLIALTPARLTTLPPFEAGAPNRLPSVLLIVIDTLRADVVSGSDDECGLTPNIAALERDGVRFDQAFATAPWTTPSFGSILTSTYPSQHHAGRRNPTYNFQYPLTRSIPTLAERMREGGYWTGAVLTNGQLGRRFDLSRGFHTYRNLVPTEFYHPVLMGLASRNLIKGWRRAYVVAEHQTSQVEVLIDLARQSERPFFLLAHYMDPHVPYDAPQILGSAPRNATTLFDRYRAEVAYCDNYLGKLLRRLKEDNAYEEMLIIVTADHGEEFNEGRLDAPKGERLSDHGHTLFDELIRVPLVIKYPGNLGAGQCRGDNVSLVDLAPTILEVSGLRAPKEFMGTSLVGDSIPAERILFAEGLMYGPEKKAVIYDNLKVILEKLPWSDKFVSVYDRSSDPAEVRPMPMDPEQELHVKALTALRTFAMAEEFPVDSSAVKVNARVLRQLRSLGYVK